MGKLRVVRGICAAGVFMVACVASAGAAGKLDDKLWAPREGFALLDPAGGGTYPVFSRGLASVNVRLPERRGRYRVRVAAAAEDCSFGWSESVIVVK